MRNFNIKFEIKLYDNMNFCMNKYVYETIEANDRDDAINTAIKMSKERSDYDNVWYFYGIEESLTSYAI